jgi:beta-lactamase regulating signal transducer with metallopeptidase domain
MIAGFVNIVAGLAPVFYTLLIMSVTAGACGLAILLVRQLSDKKLSPFMKYLMWFVVLAALIIPYRPHSDFALINTDALLSHIPYSDSGNTNQSPPASLAQSALTGDTSDKQATTGRSGNNAADPAGLFQKFDSTGLFQKSDPAGLFQKFDPAGLLQKSDSADLFQKGDPDSLSQGAADSTLSTATDSTLSTATGTPPNATGYETPGRSLTTWLFGVWLPGLWAAGVLFLAIFMLTVTIRLRRKIRSALTPAEEKKYAVKLEICKAKLGLRRKVALTVQDHIGFPSLMGVLRPRILFPLYVGELDDDCLDCILLHELSHIRRNDHILNALLLIIRIVYWFNPVVWVLCRFIKQDMEVANDAAVLKQLDGESQKSYGLSLVEVLAHGYASAFTPRLLCMADNVQNTKRRIQMIRLHEAFKQRRTLIAVLALIIIVLIGLLFLTQKNDRPADYGTPMPPITNENSAGISSTSSDLTPPYSNDDTPAPPQTNENSAVNSNTSSEWTPPYSNEYPDTPAPSAEESNGITPAADGDELATKSTGEAEPIRAFKENPMQPPVHTLMFPLEEARKSATYKIADTDGDDEDEKSYNLNLLDKFIENMKTGTPDHVQVIYYVPTEKGGVVIKDWYYLTYDGTYLTEYGYYELDDGTFEYDRNNLSYNKTTDTTIERKEYETAVNYRLRFGDRDRDTAKFFYAVNPVE